MLRARVAALVALTAPLALACAVHAAGPGAQFIDVLAQPAVMSTLSGKGLLQSVTRAGSRLVAVGQRGHIVVSPDDGKSWQQSPVPVSSDLTAVYFVDAKNGWAVGHDGVILASNDGGLTWALQLDGPRANAAILADIRAKSAAQPSSEPLKAMVSEATRNAELGADKPFLDVWFADARNGYAVGAFNLIFRTADGGATWVPWFDRTDNPKFLNLYSIRPAGSQLFIAGETGLVLKLDPVEQRFRALPAPYPGTLLGIVSDGGGIVVYGLRGNAFRSDDVGATWTKLDSGLPATIVAGTVLPDRAWLLADAGGRMSRSVDGGRTFRPVTSVPSMMVTGIADAGNGRLALAGSRGMTLTTLPALPPAGR
jgi:photosystem II stability/assembly factor-like uncharacterized protein